MDIVFKLSQNDDTENCLMKDRIINRIKIDKSMPINRRPIIMELFFVMRHFIQLFTAPFICKSELNFSTIVRLP